MESILTSMKKLLGMDEENHQFDVDVMIHINSIFVILKQLGAGPEDGFIITNEFASWSDFTQDNIQLEQVKTFMYLKLKLIFDPPINSAAIEAIKEQIKEYEWRITNPV